MSFLIVQTSPHTRVLLIKKEWFPTLGQEATERATIAQKSKWRHSLFPTRIFVAFLLLNPKYLTEAI